jgi:hypothetical protein
MAQGLGIGVMQLPQQFADRGIAVSDQPVTPGFGPVLAAGKLPGVRPEGLQGLPDRVRVATPEQFGDELQLPLAGHVGANAPRFPDCRVQGLVQRKLGKQRRAQCDQTGCQRLHFQGVAAALALALEPGSLVEIFLAFCHVVYQDSRQRGVIQ